MLFGWLAAFYNAPEGVVTPLAHALGGGALAVGVILAAQALGETVGAIVFSRFVPPVDPAQIHGPARVRHLRRSGPVPLAPGLLVSLLILFASGLCASYQLAANAAFVSAAPHEQRSQAFGLAQGGMSLGQGTVMILAGAAADHHSPARVIAVCGAVGAVVALAIAITWARGHGPLVIGGAISALGSAPALAAHGVLLSRWGGPGVARWTVCRCRVSPSSRRACACSFLWCRRLAWCRGLGLAPVSPRMACSYPSGVRMDSLRNHLNAPRGKPWFGFGARRPWRALFRCSESHRRRHGYPLWLAIAPRGRFVLNAGIRLSLGVTGRDF